MKLDAPNYPPAIAFEMPDAVPAPVSLETCSLAELENMPAAWAIITKQLPALRGVVSSSLLRPHLGNFTVHSVATFMNVATPQQIALINDELRHLPSIQSLAT